MFELIDNVVEYLLYVELIRTSEWRPDKWLKQNFKDYKCEDV